MKFRKYTENIDPKMFRTKNNRLAMQSKCSVCGIKKSRFAKEQEANSIVKCFILNAISYSIKMNEIVNTFLLLGDKFMPEIAFKTTWFYLLYLWSIYQKQKKN